MSETDIALARDGAATDQREAAPLTFAVRVLAEPASTNAEDVAELRAHGWTDRAVADVVGLVSLNLLTGAFNPVAGSTPKTADRTRRAKSANAEFRTRRDVLNESFGTFNVSNDSFKTPAVAGTRHRRARRTLPSR